MKANELRIGNLVRNNMNGEILKPCDVLCDGINTDNYEGLNYGFIEPIPLNEEWLLKFGFEIVNGWDDYKGYKKDEVEIETDFNNQEFSNYINKKVQYVHQLQNLYFALTGIELLIIKKSKHFKTC